MFNDTVFSGGPPENNDEELAVLADLENEKTDAELFTRDTESFVERSVEDTDSDMVLLEDAEIESPAVDEAFIESDDIPSSQSETLEVESSADKDIADSLGMNLESENSLTMDSEARDEMKLDIEPDLEDAGTEPIPFGTETIEDREVDSRQIDLPTGTDSPQPVSFQPEQLEAVIEKVIKKMLGQKIDRLIIDIIEKAVQTDIEKIKKELLKGTTEDS